MLNADNLWKQLIEPFNKETIVTDDSQQKIDQTDTNNIPFAFEILQTNDDKVASSSSSPTLVEQSITTQTIQPSTYEIDFEDSKSHLSDEHQQSFHSVEIKPPPQQQEADTSSQHGQFDDEEDNHSFDNLSSAVTIDYNLNENIPQLQREISRLSSHDTSFTDVEGELSPAIEQNLRTIMEGKKN